MKPTTYLLIPTALTLALGACAPFSPTSTHAGMCNELNSRTIFNGSTGNIRNAEIQNSEVPLTQSNFDTKCENGRS